MTVSTIARVAARKETQAETAAMRQVRAVVPLVVLIGVLAAVAAGLGLFWQEGGSSFSFTTLRGQTAEILGSGIYRNDTQFTGAGYRGSDALTLFLGIPLLALAAWRYRQGSLRGGLLLLGTLVYFLYVYVSLSFNAAYNNLFLLYVVLFSASLFGVILVFTAFGGEALRGHFSERMPRRGPALFMFASSLVTLVVWLQPIVTGLLERQPPERIDHYTTLVTHALDIGVIVPAAAIAGVLIWRRQGLGYLIAFALLVLEAALAPMMAAQTVSQLAAGVTFSTGEMIGPLGGFATVSLLSMWVLVALLRHVEE